MKTAEIIGLPRPVTTASGTEPDRITLNADGTHSVRWSASTRRTPASPLRIKAGRPGRLTVPNHHLPTN
jgi:hypothetical protein